MNNLTSANQGGKTEKTKQKNNWTINQTINQDDLMTPSLITRAGIRWNTLKGDTKDLAASSVFHKHLEILVFISYLRSLLRTSHLPVL